MSWTLKTSLAAVFASTMTLPSMAIAMIIGFDEMATGGTIFAPSGFSNVVPGSPTQGPIFTEYSGYGVTFSGGVVLNYERFGGPDDPRAGSGEFLASPPNLLATSDFHALQNGSLLPGTISAQFSSPVSSVSISIRNGNIPSLFEIAAFHDSHKVDADSAYLSQFLSEGQDGLLNLAGEAIDRIVVTTDQPRGKKDFGIDQFTYNMLNSKAEFHNSFRRITTLTLTDPSSQRIAKDTMVHALSTAPLLPASDQDVANTTALDILTVVNDGFTIIGAILTKSFDPFLPFVICPKELLVCQLTNPSLISSERRISSIFDIRHFTVPVEVPRGRWLDVVDEGDSFVVNSSAFPGGETAALFKITDFHNKGPNSVLIDLGIRSITRVSRADVPEPSTVVLLVPGVLLLLLIRGRRNSRDYVVHSINMTDCSTPSTSAWNQSS